jgi:hypothetical protein
MLCNAIGTRAPDVTDLGKGLKKEIMKEGKGLFPTDGQKIAVL